MKDLTRAHLDKAEDMRAAFRILKADLPVQAARLAYFAAFHAAQALIFERTARTSKTHNGVNAQFAKLVRDEGLSSDLSQFLASAYHFKAAADYEVGSSSIVGTEDVLQAMTVAETVIAPIRTHLEK